jgi:hypothetical protein
MVNVSVIDHRNAVFAIVFISMTRKPNKSFNFFLIYSLIWLNQTIFAAAKQKVHCMF